MCVFSIVIHGSIMSYKNEMINVLSWRTVYALTGVLLWCIHAYINLINLVTPVHTLYIHNKTKHNKMVFILNGIYCKHSARCTYRSKCIAYCQKNLTFFKSEMNWSPDRHYIGTVMISFMFWIIRKRLCQCCLFLRPCLILTLYEWTCSRKYKKNVDNFYNFLTLR